MSLDYSHDKKKKKNQEDLRTLESKYSVKEVSKSGTTGNCNVARSLTNRNRYILKKKCNEIFNCFLPSVFAISIIKENPNIHKIIMFNKK